MVVAVSPHLSPAHNQQQELPFRKSLGEIGRILLTCVIIERSGCFRERLEASFPALRAPLQRNPDYKNRGKHSSLTTFLVFPHKTRFKVDLGAPVSEEERCMIERDFRREFGENSHISWEMSLQVKVDFNEPQHKIVFSLTKE